MLPTREVADTAGRLIAEHDLTAVWFGAAAPLGLLASSMRLHGARRTVACTHGHEIGWSMVPGARRLLRRIAHTNDVLTFVSRYSRRRISPALGPSAALEYLPPGVDATVFRPDPAARSAIRQQHGLGTAPTVVCVSRLVPRKGQDALIRSWPQVLDEVPDARLMIVGGGRYGSTLDRLIERNKVQHSVIRTGSVAGPALAEYY